MTETPPQAPPAAAPPPPSEGWNTEHLKDYRRLRRSREDRKVAGVAGGLGRHLDVDPTILRVLFVVLVFFGGAGLVVYGAMWLLVPEDATERAAVRTSDSTRNALLISVLVVAALLAVGDSWWNYGFPWPLAVGALVFAAILMSRDRAAAPPAPPGPPGPPPAEAPPGSWTAPGYPTAPAPGYPAVEPYGAGPNPPWYPPVAAPPRDPRRTGPLLFGITLALIALGLGALGVYDASGGSVADAAYPALALAITGAMLVLGAFFGRAGGLVLIGLAATVALGGAAIANPSYDGDRDIVKRPTSAAKVADSYEVPAGRIELDLRKVADPAELDGRTIQLDANVGELVVIVPPNVDVSFGARVGYGGAIETPDGDRNGWGPTLNGSIDARGKAVADIDVEMDLDFGHIEMRQQ